MNTYENLVAAMTGTTTSAVDWQTVGQLDSIQQDLLMLHSETGRAIDDMRAARSSSNPDEAAGLLSRVLMLSHPGASGTITSRAARVEADLAVLRERLTLLRRLNAIERGVSKAVGS